MTGFVDALWRAGLKVAYRLAVAYWWLRRPKLRGVVVAVRVEDRVLVVQHSYKPGLYFPGGGVHASEDPIAAAVRELREETGIVTSEDQLRWVGQIVKREDYKMDRVQVYELRIDAEPELHIDRREIIWAEFTSIEVVRRGEIEPWFLMFLEDPIE